MQLGRVRGGTELKQKNSTSRLLAVEEVGGHEELQRDLGSDWELGDLGRAVRVTHLVREVHADLLQHVRSARARKRMFQNVGKQRMYWGRFKLSNKLNEHKETG